MKAPKYFVETMQQAINVGINPFAFQLIAESFADVPGKFGDENVVFLSRAHNGQEVWFIMSKTMPKAEDFDPPEAPATDPPASIDASQDGATQRRTCD